MEINEEEENPTNCEAFVVAHIYNGTFVQGFAFSRYGCRYDIQHTDTLRTAKFYSTQLKAENVLGVCPSADWRVCRVSLKITGVL